MNLTVSDLVLVVIPMALGNFIYQVLQTNPDFNVASERAFFQVFAVSLAWVLWKYIR